jgi:hypothetical protein
MGILESFVFGTIGYLMYTRIVEPKMRLRRAMRRRLKELEAEEAELE